MTLHRSEKETLNVTKRKRYPLPPKDDCVRSKAGHNLETVPKSYWSDYTTNTFLQCTLPKEGNSAIMGSRTSAAGMPAVGGFFILGLKVRHANIPSKISTRESFVQDASHFERRDFQEGSYVEFTVSCAAACGLRERRDETQRWPHVSIADCSIRGQRCHCGADCPPLLAARHRPLVAPARPRTLQD